MHHMSLDQGGLPPEGEGCLHPGGSLPPGAKEGLSIYRSASGVGGGVELSKPPLRIHGILRDTVNKCALCILLVQVSF